MSEHDSNEETEVQGADVRWVVDVTFPVTHRLTLGYNDFEFWDGAEDIDWTSLDDVEEFIERNADEVYQLTSERTWHDMDFGDVTIGTMRRADDPAS